jgi:predicted dehydrogenase
VKAHELRLGIVGCGAVTELAHLPILAATKGVQVTALIDRNVERAAQLAKKYGVPHVGAEIAELSDRVDAVVLAVPHALHARMATQLLGRRLHVLVEKPMALTAAECDQMIEAGRQNGAVLAVGLMRRFAPWARFTKRAVDSGCLGRIVSFEYREGYIYRWPVASDFMFRKEAAGGGVLIDTGAHTLDSVLWWLGDVERFEYYDDAEGGVEADCAIHMTLASGAAGIVELSRTRHLPNRVIIRGDRGILEATSGTAAITLDGYRLAGPLEAPANSSERDEYLALMAASLHDWLTAVRQQHQPLVTGEEGRRSVAFIEACYRNRQPLAYPWLQDRIPAIKASA